ncbi:acetone carboxylase [Ornithinimicrobium murale]|uniref:acetone carboxylase n=1 Tax=Ornithinimicrobium murale TaxID=1050153 RepID=UPI000E0DBA17|nr:acetone carboxylase [Ornithinimicrobium murale]
MLTCSAKGCRATATHGVVWNNPKVHQPERRKVWLACLDHRESLSAFLSVRGFLIEVLPVDQLGERDG